MAANATTMTITTAEMSLTKMRAVIPNTREHRFRKIDTQSRAEPGAQAIPRGCQNLLHQRYSAWEVIYSATDSGSSSDVSPCSRALRISEELTGSASVSKR